MQDHEHSSYVLPSNSSTTDISGATAAGQDDARSSSSREDDEHTPVDLVATMATSVTDYVTHHDVNFSRRSSCSSGSSSGIEVTRPYVAPDLSHRESKEANATSVANEKVSTNCTAVSTFAPDATNTSSALALHKPATAQSTSSGTSRGSVTPKSQSESRQAGNEFSTDASHSKSDSSTAREANQLGATELRKAAKGSSRALGDQPILILHDQERESDGVASHSGPRVTFTEPVTIPIGDDGVGSPRKSPRRDASPGECDDRGHQALRYETPFCHDHNWEGFDYLAVNLGLRKNFGCGGLVISPKIAKIFFDASLGEADDPADLVLRYKAPFSHQV